MTPFRRLLTVLAACAVLAPPLAAFPAQASGDFDMVNNNQNEFSYSCLIDDQFGAGHQLVMDVNQCSLSGTDFFLSNENIIGGVVTWEISDEIGCMNRSDNTGVYINSCIPGDSTEEWIFDAEGHVENVHAGTNGYLNVDCNQITQCPETVVAVHPTNPWTTPAS